MFICVKFLIKINDLLMTFFVRVFPKMLTLIQFVPHRLYVNIYGTTNIIPRKSKTAVRASARTPFSSYIRNARPGVWVSHIYSPSITWMLSLVATICGCAKFVFMYIYIHVIIWLWSMKALLFVGQTIHEETCPHPYSFMPKTMYNS